MSESPSGDAAGPAGEAWEDTDCVRRTIVLPTDLAEALAGQAERRGLSVSDLLAEYAADGLRRDGGQELPGASEPALVVTVAQEKSQLPAGDLVPSEVGGVPTDVRELEQLQPARH